MNNDKLERINYLLLYKSKEEIIDMLLDLQQEKEELINKLNKAKEFVNKNMVIHSNAFGVVWCDIDEKGKEELLNILDLEKR